MEKGFKGALTLSLALWPALWHHLNSGWRPLSSSVSVSEVDFSKPCSFFLASREQASEHPHHSHSPLPLCGTKELRVREERAELRREKEGRGKWTWRMAELNWPEGRSRTILLHSESDRQTEREKVDWTDRRPRRCTQEGRLKTEN